ncbi:PD-(D/E)XK motif protein [Geodermatophilus sp. URMC 63]
MTDAFVQRWRQLLTVPGSKSEVDATHPLRIIYGSDELGRPLLFVICDHKPALPDLSDVVDVSRLVRARDGRWTLSMTLLEDAYLDVFFAFAADVVRRTSAGSSEATALRLLFKVLREWKLLFARGGGKPLSFSALRGLIGELWFGFHHLTVVQSPHQVVRAWRGPLGADQDFRFESGGTYEVKTLYPDRFEVTISSSEQLDLDSMTLSVVVLDEADEADEASITLRQLILDASERLADDDDGLDLLAERLRRYQIYNDGSAYDDFHFKVVGVRSFGVDNEFPRLRRSSIPSVVKSVEYSLDLRHLTDFEVEIPEAICARQGEGGEGSHAN